MDSLVAQNVIGQADAVREILTSIRSGLPGGALIIGDWGLGKTAVTNAVLQDLGDGVPAVRIHTGKTLSRVPYGALAPLLSDLSADELLSFTAVWRELTAHLTTAAAAAIEDGSVGAEGMRILPVVVIDDGDYLDTSSVAMIEQLIAAKKIYVLTTARDGYSPVGIVSTEGLLTRYYLGPLDLPEVHELCEQTLGGTVAGCSSATLARISGGNPRLLLALISHARRRGQLNLSNGVWLLTGESVPFDKELTDIVQSQLSALPQDVREVLELVTLAEPLPLHIVFSLGGYDAVDILSGLKLITISGAPDPAVCSRDPLHGEVIRQLIPTGRTRRLRERLMEHLPPGSGSADAQLRDVQWSLEWGQTVSETELVDAARTAINSFDPDFAISAAEAVKDPAHVAAARVECAWACYLRGDRIRATELLNGVPAIVDDTVSLKRAVVLAIRLRSHTGEPDRRLQADADAWSAALVRITKIDVLNETGSGQESTRRTIELLVQSICVGQGSYEDATGILNTVLADAEADHDDESVLLALTMLGECAAATGRSETGAKLTGRALTMLTDSVSRWRIHYEYVLTRHVMALIWSGQWEEVTKAHRQYWTTSWRSSVYSGGAIDFARSLVSLSHGRGRTHADTEQNLQAQVPDTDEADLIALVAAIEGLRSYDLEHLLPLALATAAYTSASLGRLELAEEYRASFEQVQQGGTFELRLLGRGFNSAAGLLLTGDEKAMHSLISCAEQAQSAGMRTTELELRLLALHNGNLSGNPRLLVLTEQMEGPQASLTRACVSAMTDENISLLITVAEQAGEAGYGELAITSLKEAHRLVEDAGHLRQTRNISRLLDLARGRPTRTPTSTPAPKLTKRERAVVAQTLEGRSNADIADKLFLSVRTVEGHLYRAFVKLGIARREDLTPRHLHKH